MTVIKLRIMVRACKIRIAAGEVLDDILASYPALNDADRKQIRAEIEPAPELTPGPAPEPEPTPEAPTE